MSKKKAVNRKNRLINPRKNYMMMYMSSRGIYWEDKGGITFARN